MEESVFKTEEKKKVEIVLLGQKLALKSNRSEEYLQKLANFISDQIEGIRKGSRSVSTSQSILLVTLKIADMLKEKEDELFQLKEDIKTKTATSLSDVEAIINRLSASSSFPTAENTGGTANLQND